MRRTNNVIRGNKDGVNREDFPCLGRFAGFLLLSAALILMVTGLSGCGNGIVSGAATTLPAAVDPNPDRIISTAPSITEMIFAIGAGDQLAGVSKFCKYPPEALDLPQVGGLLDPSGESIVRLDPDLVIVFEENLKFRNQLSAEGYKVLAVDHKTIAGIIDSAAAIGRACGREEEGLELAGRLRSRVEKWQGRIPSSHDRPRILISVGRNAGNGDLGKIYIAGRDDYYDEMIGLAGGVNAYRGKIRYPMVSTEGLLRMNPDVIIDLVPGYLERGLKEESLLEEWNEARGTRAFEDRNIYIMGEDFWTLPGPRFVQVIESLNQLTIED